MHCNPSKRIVDGVIPLACVLVACALPTGLAHALEPGEIFRQVRSAIVAVHGIDVAQSKREQGSGVLVSATSAVTNCHVVRKATKIEVVHGKETREARLRFQDLQRNLCQLELATAIPAYQSAPAIKPSSGLEVGQTVYAVSLPYGDEHTFVRGMIAGLKSRPGEDAKLIQTDVAVAPGSSGGGLFDSDARLIGIVTAGLNDAQNLNIALPAEWVQQLPTRNLDRLTANVQDTPAPPSSEAAQAVISPDEPWRPQTGDRWVYRMRQGTRELGKVNVEIVRSKADRVREVITREGSSTFRLERDVDPVFDPSRFLEVVTLPGGYRLLELSPYFPPGEKVQPGRSWRDVGVELPLLNIGRRSAQFEVRIVGQETVIVPAGRFNAWKIEARSNLMSNQTRVDGTYWYAPEVTRVVKITSKSDSAFTGLRSEESYELLSFPQAARRNP